MGEQRSEPDEGVDTGDVIAGTYVFANLYKSILNSHFRISNKL